MEQSAPLLHVLSRPVRIPAVALCAVGAAVGSRPRAARRNPHGEALAKALTLPLPREGHVGEVPCLMNHMERCMLGEEEPLVGVREVLRHGPLAMVTETAARILAGERPDGRLVLVGCEANGWTGPQSVFPAPAKQITRPSSSET
jgi:hypothetical protein